MFARFSPLVAVISQGTFLRHFADSPLSVDASKSQDPDSVGDLEYEWFCNEVAEADPFKTLDPLIVLADSPSCAPFFSDSGVATLTIGSDSMPAGSFFDLTVRLASPSTSREARAAVRIEQLASKSARRR